MYVHARTHKRTNARKQQMVTIAIKPNRIACDTLDLQIFGTGDHTTRKPLSQPTSCLYDLMSLLTVLIHTVQITSHRQVQLLDILHTHAHARTYARTHAHTHTRKQQLVTKVIKPNRNACDNLDLQIFETGDHTTTKPLSQSTSSTAVAVFAQSDATPDGLDPHRTNHQSPPRPVAGYPPHTGTRTHARTTHPHM